MKCKLTLNEKENFEKHPHYYDDSDASQQKLPNVLPFTLDFVASFEKHCIILLLQLGDVTESLIQDHNLALQMRKCTFQYSIYKVINLHCAKHFLIMQKSMAALSHTCLSAWEQGKRFPMRLIPALIFSFLCRSTVRKM